MPPVVRFCSEKTIPSLLQSGVDRNCGPEAITRGAPPVEVMIRMSHAPPGTLVEVSRRNTTLPPLGE